MSNIPNPESIFDAYDNSDYGSWGPTKSCIIGALKAYGRIVRLETLKWAADNADIERESIDDIDYYGESNYWVVSRESILKGETDKDLDI